MILEEIQLSHEYFFFFFIISIQIWKRREPTSVISAGIGDNREHI